MNKINCYNYCCDKNSSQGENFIKELDVCEKFDSLEKCKNCNKYCSKPLYTKEENKEILARLNKRRVLAMNLPKKKPYKPTEPCYTFYYDELEQEQYNAERMGFVTDDMYGNNN